MNQIYLNMSEDEARELVESRFPEASATQLKILQDKLTHTHEDFEILEEKIENGQEYIDELRGVIDETSTTLQKILNCIEQDIQVDIAEHLRKVIEDLNQYIN